MTAIARAEAWLSSPTTQDEAANIIIDLLELLDEGVPEPEPLLHPILECEMILRVLDAEGKATAGELSDTLGLGLSIIRRQLRRLCYEGRVVCIKPPRFPGRPRSGFQQSLGEPAVYGLTADWRDGRRAR